MDTAMAEQRLTAALENAMDQAAQYVVGFVKESINRSQPVRKTRTGWVGLDPSAPGEPPKKLSVTLQPSISHEMRSEPGAVVARIGTNVPYAKHLELGTSKMKPRPFLVPGLNNSLDTAKATIAARLRRG